MIPFNLSKLTVRQYQIVNEIFDSQDDLLDKQINAIAYLLGKSTNYVESLPLDLFKYYSSQLTMIKSGIKCPVKKYIWVKGRLFKGTKDLSELLTGQYFDLKNLSNDGEIKNLHKLLACVYKPVFGKYDHKKCSDILLDAKIEQVYGLLFFYTNEYERLKSYIQMCLEEASKTIQTEMEEMAKDLEGS